jgi:hypothetical protein
MSAGDSAQLSKTLDRGAEGSPAWRAWVLDHEQYLAALDPGTARKLESLLEREYKGQFQRATKGGSKSGSSSVSGE